MDAPDINYWWFEPDQARALARLIAKAGNHLTRLRAVPDFTREPASLTFYVETDKADDEMIAIHEQGHVNDSHLCPPECS